MRVNGERCGPGFGGIGQGTSRCRPLTRSGVSRNRGGIAISRVRAVCPEASATAQCGAGRRPRPFWSSARGAVKTRCVGPGGDDALAGICYDFGVPDASPSPEQQLADVASRHPALRLLLLFGSRARGDAHEQFDWDLGYLAGPGLDPDALLLDLVNALDTDRVDLVDLARAGGQVRFRAARDGRRIHEASPGTFEAFWTDAVTFWCDAEPLLRTGYAEALARLRR